MPVKTTFPTMFHNLKNYEAQIIMHKIGKFDFKIYDIPSRLEKYMSFSLDHKLVFNGSFQSSSLDSLVKKLGENHFKHLSQELDSEVFDLVKQKGFYPYEYMSSFEKYIYI